MGQKAVGHVQHGLGGAVILLQADDARARKKFGEIQNIADIGPAKGIDGLGFVAHGHDVAGYGCGFPAVRILVGRPGQQAHNAGLDQIGVLVFVHQDMAEAQAQGFGGGLVFAQQGFQLKEQVVVVQQALFAAVGGIGFAQSREGFGVGQKVEGFAPQHFFQGQFLVPGFAQQAHDALGLGEGAVAPAQLELVLAVFDRRRDVRRIHDREGPFAQPGGAPAAQHAVGEGVEGAALHAGKALVQKHARALEHLLRGLAGEGQQQDGRGRDAVLGQPGQAVDDGAGFAAARACHDQHGTVAAGGRRVLGFVEGLGVINHEISIA